MSETIEWQAEKFKTVYEEELRFLERRRAHDSSCTIKDAQGILKNLYIQEGNNQHGRGLVQDIVLSATIAAYEFFIDDWKKESS